MKKRNVSFDCSLPLVAALVLQFVVVEASQAQCPAQWSILDNDVPTARWRHVMAVDTDRNVLVMFGGDTGEVSTWEWSLPTNGPWTKRPTVGSPSRRGNSAMVFDRSRHRMVMTGGQSQNIATATLTPTAEVWEYDGSGTGPGRWTLSVPLPQARSQHAMAYDTVRDTIVLYGGLLSGTNSVDVLERPSSSSAWVIKTSTIHPEAQNGHCMAFDPVRNRTLLVGAGTTSAVGFEWDGSTWEQLTFSGNVPTRRVNSGLVYDASRSRFVFYAGQGIPETWEYESGTRTWTPKDNGPRRDDHAVAYDPVGQRMLVIGGLAGISPGNPQRDLRAFTGRATPGTQWALIWSRTSPSPRYLPCMAFDEARGNTILFGGGLVTNYGGFSAAGDTWLFNGTAWQSQTVTSGPPTRFAAPLVYDPNRAVMVLYGGLTDAFDSSASSLVHEFDPATRVWTDRTPTPSTPPGQRYSQAAAFDRARNQMVVFGGRNQVGTRLSDTWLYNPSNFQWTQATTPISPGRREAAAMAFDEHRGKIVLFGGFTSASDATTDAMTWEWDGSRWMNVTPATSNPPSRARHTMTYDPVRRTIILTGGINAMTTNQPQLTDMWEFDGTAWRQFNQSGDQPICRVNAGVVYDRSRHRLLQFGGIPFGGLGGGVAGGGNGATWYGIDQTAACTLSLSTCVADLDDGSGNGCPDGGVTIDDLLYYLGQFADGTTRSDLDDGSGTGTPDGGVTIDDLLFYLYRFGQGC